jgi:RNA polymerase sigma-70 factor (ECF subfamily)
MTLRQYNIIVNRFSDNIFRFILKNLSDRALAEDFTQDTFSILWIHHKDVDFEKAKEEGKTVGDIISELAHAQKEEEDENLLDF